MTEKSKISSVQTKKGRVQVAEWQGNDPSRMMLPAKSSVPSVKTTAVNRPALWRLFDEAVENQVSLILVSAPAGYGKTTAVSQWLHNARWKSAWLTLDRLDNDPSRFFSYLLAALNDVTDSAAVPAAAANALASPKLPSPEMVASLLSAGIAPVDEFVVLALDDFHMVQNTFLQDTLQALVNLHVPGFTLVIVTREDPPMFLSRLRTQERLLEVRTRELTFSRDETEAFYQNAMNIDLPDTIVDSVILKTEGWIAALQLCGLSLRNTEPEQLEQAIEKFDASSRYVVDYLFEEVMHHLSEEVREFLFDTAALDRLTEDLCNLVTDRNDSGRMLRDMEEDNLFLIALDSQRSWYRYHHLFSAFLRDQAPEERQLRAADCAAQWFQSQGFKDEAVKYAMRSNDQPLTERMIMDEIPGAFAVGQHQLLMNWLESLSGSYVRSSFAIGVYQAWVLFFAGKLDDLLALVEHLDSIATKHEGTVSFGRYQSLKAWLAESRSGFEPDPSDQSEDEDNGFFRVLSLQASGLMAYRRGATEESVGLLRSAYTLGRTIRNPFVALCVLHRLAFYLTESGERAVAEELCSESLAIFSDRNEDPLPITGLSSIALAACLYERDELSEAAELADRGLDLVSRLRLGDVLVEDGIRTAASIRHAVGDSDGATALVSDALRDAVATARPHSVSRFGAFAAEMAIRNGDVTEAEEWAQTNGVSVEALMASSPDSEHTTFSLLLLATGRLGDARKLLESMASWYESAGRVRSLISTEVLLARVLAGEGQDEDAGHHLGKALSLAAPREYLRAILDVCGDGNIIDQLHPDSTPFVEALLTRVGAPDSEKSAGNHLPEAKPPIDSLSKREREVLGLINEGLSNRDIGERLFVSTGTVKWHVNNILRKLGVSSRSRAALLFRQLGPK